MFSSTSTYLITFYQINFIYLLLKITFSLYFLVLEETSILVKMKNCLN